MKRYLMIASGRVQGVGFRYFVLLIAKKTQVTGTVRNQSNGMVEIIVQGDDTQIETFKAQLMKGNGFSRINDLSTKEVPVVEKEKAFRISY